MRGNIQMSNMSDLMNTMCKVRGDEDGRRALSEGDI